MKIETQGHYKAKGQGQILEFKPFWLQMVKICKLTLTFGLDMTFRMNCHWLRNRYQWYLNTDQIWLKYNETMRFSGRNCANFTPQNDRNSKLDIDLWPWNDLEGEFSVAVQEVSLIPKHRSDMTKMYWNYAAQWKKQCSFWSKNAENSKIWPWPLTLKWPWGWICSGC